MTSRKPCWVEISNINIFHITQYFLVKSYKRIQWNLPNILAHISGIFDDFFKAGLVPLINSEVIVDRCGVRVSAAATDEVCGGWAGWMSSVLE